MSFRNLRSLGVVVALTLLTLSYQNCARTNFAIDDSLKEAKLSNAQALGGVVATGDDVGTPGAGNAVGDDTPSAPGATNPPGTDTPSTPGTKNPPGTDTPSTPGTKNPPGTDTPSTPGTKNPPGTDTPSTPGTKNPPGTDTPSTPGTKNPPGTDTPSTPGTKNPPGTDTPSTPGTKNPPGTDTPSTPGTKNPPGSVTPSTPGTKNPPGTDTPSTPGTKNPPGTDTPSTPGTTSTPGTDSPTTNPTFIAVETICPSILHTAKKTVVQAKGSVKLVFLPDGLLSSKTCEILDVGSQIVKNHKIDISKCAASISSLTKTPALMYLVEESVTSNYAANKINENDYYLAGFSLDIVYTMYSDTANAASCDIMGDPLLVQLGSKSNQADPINLTSAQNGVMFDLLGKRNNYEKVQTAWFADNKSENYFLVLPDSYGQVKGIDQLFGDATFGPDKHYSKQGFQALAKYDKNKDKMISFDDPVYTSLRLWKDENLDGIVQANELFTLEEKGVVAIDLRFDRKYKELDQYGNMVKYKSIVIMKDNSYGLVFDLWLRYIQK